MSQGNSPVADLGRRGSDAPEFAVGSGVGSLRQKLTDEQIAETVPFIHNTHDAVIAALTDEARARCEG